MSEDRTDELPEATARAAELLARALLELQQPLLAGNDSAAKEVAAARRAMEDLARSLSQQAAAEREQRLLLANQLTHLAAALETLVGHLQGLSELMSRLLDKVAVPTEAASGPPADRRQQKEAAFQPGGEGVSLTLTNVPGFQALMDLQQAIAGLDAVEAASVERFQEGDSRLLLRLKEPLLARELVEAAGRATGLTLVVEESKPELASLRLKVV